MTQSKTLYLIDAYALIFRGYYAFIKNPRIMFSCNEINGMCHPPRNKSVIKTAMVKV